MKIYNWGIVATGNISTSFALALKSTENGRVAAVCSRSEESARAFTEKLSLSDAAVFTDVSEMAKSGLVDIIYVGTPHTAHVSATIESLECGIPVLCEKPFALNLESAKTAFALAERKQLFLMEALWTRFLPAIRKVKEWIDAGLIGEINEIHAAFSYPQAESRESRLFAPSLGGGALLDVGVYPIFLSHWLFGGTPDRIETSMLPAQSGTDIDYTAVLHFGEHKKSLISSTFCYPAHVATVIGTRGYITIPDLCCAHSAYLFIGGELIASFSEELQNGMRYEAIHVMDCLDKGLLQSPVYPLSMTVDELTTCDRIRKSWGLVYPDELSAAAPSISHAAPSAPDWYRDSVFYHIYPLGMCGSLERNDFCSPPSDKLSTFLPIGDYISSLGANAVYFGPLFESTYHGYDTKDYYTVDRRLGDEGQLSALCSSLHDKGIRVIFDGVFNHVGRDFWAFRDVLEKGEGSQLRDWFFIDFGARSPFSDPFGYECWEGCYDLVKLNLNNRDARAHILGAVKSWIERFDIDGLRLDVAYSLDPDFLRELRTFCLSLKPDFFILGECLHGDYKTWCNDGMCHSATNYECYKGLYSSVNSINMHEIAYSLNRQFGAEAWTLYKGLPLYSFLDNHDVTRIASMLRDKNALKPLYALLFAMPGIPSVYYGSELAIEGSKEQGDQALRPRLSAEELSSRAKDCELSGYISALISARRSSKALCRGSYAQLHVAPGQLVFERRADDERVIFAINIENEAKVIHFNADAGRARDLVTGETIDFGAGLKMQPYSAMLGLVY